MHLNIAICDDSQEDIEQLKRMILVFSEKYDFSTEFTTFTSGLTLLQHIEHPHCFDVVFLDIEMPDCDGLKVAYKIRETIGTKLRLVYVSSYPKYMQQAFDVQAYHFITKPLSESFVEKVLLRIIKDMGKNMNAKICIETEHGRQCIYTEDIQYIETHPLKKGVLIYHLATSSLLVRGRIGQLETDYQQWGFYLCHRSFLVNIHHVHCIETDSLQLDNSATIPLSRNKRKNIQLQFTQNIVFHLGE